MLAHGPDERCLRSLIAFGLRKTDFLAFVQVVEMAIGNAVAVKVDLVAIAARDEAVIFFGMKRCDYAVGRYLVFLDVTFPLPDDVLQLPASGLERIADRHVNVLVRSSGGGFAADHDIGGIGNDEMNPYVKDVTLVMPVLGPRDDHAGADDPVEKLLELLCFVSDSRLDGIGMLNAFERDLQGNVHSETFNRIRNETGFRHIRP